MDSKRTKAEEAYLKKIGKQMRTIRESLRLSQEGLADECELDRTYISDVERGTRNISVLNLRKIAKALNVKPAHFLVDV